MTAGFSHTSRTAKIKNVIYGGPAIWIIPYSLRRLLLAHQMSAYRRSPINERSILKKTFWISTYKPSTTFSRRKSRIISLQRPTLTFFPSHNHLSWCKRSLPTYCGWFHSLVHTSMMSMYWMIYLMETFHIQSVPAWVLFGAIIKMFLRRGLHRKEQCLECCQTQHRAVPDRANNFHSISGSGTDYLIDALQNSTKSNL